MGQVLIHRPWLALCAADWDSGCGGVIQKGVTAGKTLVEFWHSPWCNDLDLWLQSIECKLETNLIVTLSGATVADCEAALLLCNGNLGSGNNWACERGTEKVDVLVDGIALNSWEAELFNELLSQVLNVDSNGSNLQCLLLGSLEVLCVNLMSVFEVCISWSSGEIVCVPS